MNILWMFYDVYKCGNPLISNQLPRETADSLLRRLSTSIVLIVQSHKGILDVQHTLTFVVRWRLD